MLPSFIVSRKAAARDPTRHQFVQGLGHIAHEGEPDIPDGVKGGKACAPPGDTEHGSLHVFNPSHGAPPMRLRWNAQARAWEPTSPGNGNRMAWTPDFLSRAGWEYVGPAEGDSSKRRRK